jgi:hypothetical protein
VQNNPVFVHDMKELLVWREGEARKRLDLEASTAETHVIAHIRLLAQLKERHPSLSSKLDNSKSA